MLFPFATAWPRRCDGSGWAISGNEIGEVYVYAIVEADGPVHDLTVYGGHNKWMEKQVSKLVRRWNFLACSVRHHGDRFGGRVCRWCVWLPEWATIRNKLIFLYSRVTTQEYLTAPQYLNTGINKYINTVNDH